MILFKREYHRFIEVYHWSWMQAVSTFTFLTTSKWNPNDTDMDLCFFCILWSTGNLWDWQPGMPTNEDYDMFR